MMHCFGRLRVRHKCTNWVNVFILLYKIRHGTDKNTIQLLELNVWLGKLVGFRPDKLSKLDISAVEAVFYTYPSKANFKSGEYYGWIRFQPEITGNIQK